MDQDMRKVLDTLEQYRRDHPNAQIDVQRQNNVSLRIRIIDPDFDGVSRADREPELWTLLRTLPEDVLTCITMLLLLTPDEKGRSLANQEFENPIPSQL